MSTEALQLAPESIEAIARRVVVLVEALPRPGFGGHFLTAAEVADRLGTGRDWVYANADRLGVIRLSSDSGHGRRSRPRLRFDPLVIERALADDEDEIPTTTTEPARRWRRAHTDSDVELLPIGGASAGRGR